jgi:hypothetical protein
VAAEVFVPPVTTGSSGYLFPNDQYQRERESQRTQQQAAPREQSNQQAAQNGNGEIKLDAAAQARVKAAIQALVPEYNQRTRRDGEASANEWIRQKAFVIGQQEGERARQNQKQ